MPNRLRVTAIQRLCVNDGPGIRTIVFMKGCSLKCPWCCNPETIHHDDDLYYNNGSCLYPQNNKICRNCVLHGGKQEKEICPLNVYTRTYDEYTSEELLNLILKDKPLFENDGGVTFSGGEPLIHSKLLLPILKELKRRNIHIAYESTLFSKRKDYDEVCSFVDYWIVDLKFQYGFLPNDDYQISSSDFYENLKDLQARKMPLKYRMVVMDDILDRVDYIAQKLISYNIYQIELLPCHSLAEIKYRQLDKKFARYKMPSNGQMQQMSEMLKQHGIESTFLCL